MKNVLKIISAYIIFSTFFSCTTYPAKYSDVKEVLNKMIITYEIFIDEINNSKNGNDVKNAIFKFINKMKKLDTMGEGLNLKYPELQDDRKVPKKLLTLQEKLINTATSERTKATAIIILSYSNERDVKIAADMLSQFLDGQ